MSGPPRALIDELVARWKLSRLKLLVVEGPYDQRYFHILKSEQHCGKGLRDIDVWTIDAIEVPGELVVAQGFVGTGAKQRAISFVRQMETQGQQDGFRGLVDRDIDPFIGLNHASAAVLYTDHSCLEATLWARESLRRLLIQYRCEEVVDTAEKIDRLYKSILEVCQRITAVRIANERFPHLALSLHHSDAGLSLDGVMVALNLEIFAEQCKPAKGHLAEAKTKIKDILGELVGAEPLDTFNGHDLVWILSYALKRLTKEATRQVTEEIVSGSLLSHGLANLGVMRMASIAALDAWASP